jgi:hypothetical protein
LYRHKKRAEHFLGRIAKQTPGPLYINLKPYLETRGLELAMDKTKITHIEKGLNYKNVILM